MKIKWYGHSCFKLINKEGISVLTDPCSPDTGYVLSDIEADIVTVSHDHYDHNYVQAVKGSPIIIRESGEFEEHGVKIKGIMSYHDTVHGQKRGKNIVYKFVTDDLSIVHMGDIGDIDDENLIKAIGKADVLLVPIGGVYTIDAPEARRLANMLHAHSVIPMHYKTAALTFELGDLDTFVDHAVDCSIHRLNQSEATIEKEFLGKDRILILSYAKDN